MKIVAEIFLFVQWNTNESFPPSQIEGV